MSNAHDRHVAYLDRVRERGRLAHAYLFYGPDSESMMQIAKDLAKVLLCPVAMYGGLASIHHGVCKECTAVDTDMHPFVVRLDLAHTLVSKKEARKDIPIDDIRELKRLFSLTTPGGGWRVAVIGQADTMSRDAGDAFLKLLEEPGERTLFILIAGQRESVSATIRSRSVSLSFGTAMPVEEKMRTTVRTALNGGIPELLALSEKVSQDALTRASAITAVISLLRAKMHAVSAGDERLKLARRLIRVLDIATILETTNVNSRLALDVMFLGAVRDV